MQIIHVTWLLRAIFFACLFAIAAPALPQSIILDSWPGANRNAGPKFYPDCELFQGNEVDLVTFGGPDVWVIADVNNARVWAGDGWINAVVDPANSENSHVLWFPVGGNPDVEITHISCEGDLVPTPDHIVVIGSYNHTTRLARLDEVRVDNSDPLWNAVK